MARGIHQPNQASSTPSNGGGRQISSQWLGMPRYARQRLGVGRGQLASKLWGAPQDGSVWQSGEYLRILRAVLGNFLSPPLGLPLQIPSGQPIRHCRLPSCQNAMTTVGAWIAHRSMQIDGGLGRRSSRADVRSRSPAESRCFVFRCKPGFSYDLSAISSWRHARDYGRHFVCYRRDDSKWSPAGSMIAWRRHSAPTGFFRHRDGASRRGFRRGAGESVGACRVLLAVIGPAWLDIVERRLADSDRLVRIENRASLSAACGWCRC